MKEILQKSIFQWAILVAWVGVVSVLSLLPADNLSKGFFNIPHADKIVHFGFYFVFGALMLRACSFSKSFSVHNSWYVCIIVPIVYSGVIELLQEYMVTTRHAEFLDLFFNILGSILGVVLYKRLYENNFSLLRFFAAKKLASND